MKWNTFWGQQKWVFFHRYWKALILSAFQHLFLCPFLPVPFVSASFDLFMKKDCGKVENDYGGNQKDEQGPKVPEERQNHIRTNHPTETSRQRQICTTARKCDYPKERSTLGYISFKRDGRFRGVFGCCFGWQTLTDCMTQTLCVGGDFYIDVENDLGG
jgi:hypothetical protein